MGIGWMQSCMHAIFSVLDPCMETKKGGTDHAVPVWALTTVREASKGARTSRKLIMAQNKFWMEDQQENSQFRQTRAQLFIQVCMRHAHSLDTES
jgi:hypothetical protein